MTHTELKQAKEGIGIRLREARLDRGITQERLGELAGTNQSVIQKIENGKTMHPRMVAANLRRTRACKQTLVLCTAIVRFR